MPPVVYAPARRRPCHYGETVAGRGYRGSGSPRTIRRGAGPCLPAGRQGLLTPGAVTDVVAALGLLAPAAGESAARASAGHSASTIIRRSRSSQGGRCRPTIARQLATVPCHYGDAAAAAESSTVRASRALDLGKTLKASTKPGRPMPSDDCSPVRNRPLPLRRVDVIKHGSHLAGAVHVSNSVALSLYDFVTTTV